MLLLINTSISFLIKIFNHIVNIISHMYGRYVHQCFLNPSFTSCKYLVVVLLILALSIIYNTIQSTDSLKDKNDKNCPYQNSNQLSIECKSRFKLPVRNFVCKLHKFFFGKECRSYLEQKLIYDKDIPIAVTANQSLDKFSSSKSLEKEFKRSISRLYELTSKNYKL